MLLRFDPTRQFDCSADPIAAALALVVQGITKNGTVHPAAGKAARAARIHRLIEDKAWTDAALALIELELPQWTLRRLAFEDGEWFCLLSMRPDCPAELDETAEAHHAVLPLAIMQAATEAWGRTAARRGTSVPQIRPLALHAVCCDKFRLSGFSEGRRPAVFSPRQPARPEVVTHVSGTCCYLCLRYGQKRNWRAGRDETGHRYVIAAPIDF